MPDTSGATQRATHTHTQPKAPQALTASAPPGLPHGEAAWESGLSDSQPCALAEPNALLPCPTSSACRRLAAPQWPSELRVTRPWSWRRRRGHSSPRVSRTNVLALGRARRGRSELGPTCRAATPCRRYSYTPVARRGQRRAGEDACRSALLAWARPQFPPVVCAACAGRDCRLAAGSASASLTGRPRAGSCALSRSAVGACPGYRTRVRNSRHRGSDMCRFRGLRAAQRRSIAFAYKRLHLQRGAQARAIAYRHPRP